MKTGKKVLSLLLAFAVTVGCLCVPNVNAQAAAVRSNTFTYDNTKGVLYEAAKRIGVKTQNNYDNEINVYLANPGDYVASVKSNSSNLVAKICYTRIIKSENSWTTCSEYDTEADLRFKSNYRIECYAPKAGTYTLTVTIKNAAKKTTCTKKVKVYAGASATPFDYFSYAGVKYYGGGDVSIPTTKAKGKVAYKVNSGFSVKGMYFGTYDSNGVIQYKAIKNKSSVTLATSTAYTEITDSYSYGTPGSSYYSYTEYGEINDYIKPVSFVKITYYDKKLKITRDAIYTIVNVK